MKRTNAQMWREEATPEDSAPAPRDPEADLAEWGVTIDEARRMLERQVCPICGEGPWQSPLNHVARKHGIDRFTMRNICGITTTTKVADPELSERFSERGRNADLTHLRDAARSRKKQRWTRAGLAKNAATIAEQNERPGAAEQREKALQLARTPEARTKRSRSMRIKWDNAPDSARAAVRDRLARTPEQLSEQSRSAWERRGLQPCGTVASYKRGCRCDECKAAKQAIRPARQVGVDGNQNPLHAEVVLAGIASATCPWCALGPLAVLAIHTQTQHNVTAAQLREMAGLGKYDSICAPDYAEKRAEMRRQS